MRFRYLSLRTTLVGAAALVAVPVAFAAVSGGFPNGFPEPEVQPNDPGSETSLSGDQSRAGSGDKDAAARLIREGGWKPAGALSLEASSRDAGQEMSLFSYQSKGEGTPHLLLIVGNDPIGGVHGTCSEPRTLEVCGSAVAASPGGRGFALVVGRAPEGTASVSLSLASKSTVDARVGGSGEWFARVPLRSNADVPSEVSAVLADRTTRTIAAGDLAGHVTETLGDARKGG